MIVPSADPPGARAAARAALGLAALAALLLLLLAAGLSLGSAPIPVADAALSLLGRPIADPVWEDILWQIRLPRCLAAILGGASLALSGLLMQTLFRNPLAGPFSLGISSGAALGAALVILAAASLPASGGPSASAPFSYAAGAVGAAAGLGAAGAAMIGAGAAMALVLAVSRRIRDNSTLLILGLMFGQMAGGLVSLLQAFAPAEQIRAFAFWSFGSFAGVPWTAMPALAGAFLAGLAAAAACVKPLNALLLGETYASSMGVSLDRVRLLLLGGASAMAGAVTAYCGPVAFLGLAVPHLCRGLFRTADHRLLVPAAVLLGAGLALASDIAASLPGSDRSLPLNAVTALIGAPVVIRVLLRQRRGRT
jgi:iron complex transport system permease protein